MNRNRRPKGIAMHRKTGKILKDKEANTWTKFTYNVRLTGFSKRTRKKGCRRN